ncbi:hypothetical protein [Hymenobacter sp. HDW8]|uniref:hypothetical protein n=1 Tax=Hymenobacter sp. HDW8 TaxID=2714932 RepID=UPI001F0D030E|nr:hypothetical protein [Hymenobacter sp. HDW8]
MRKLLAVVLLCLAAQSVIAQVQTLPLYTGTIPNSKPSSVQETSTTLPNGGVRISNVVQPTLTVFLPPATKPTARASLFARAAAIRGFLSTTKATM